MFFFINLGIILYIKETNKVIEYFGHYMSKYIKMKYKIFCNYFLSLFINIFKCKVIKEL